MSDLHFDLPIGIVYDKDKPPVREVELLPINGVAERVILKRLANKPYTWTARLLTACIGRLGNKEIAGPARKKYLETTQMEINNLITKMSIGDVNTAILEIHRKLWAPKLSDQPYVCTHCGNQGTTEMDLSEIDYNEDDKQLLESESLAHLLDFTVELSRPIPFSSPKNAQGESSNPAYDGRPVTAFTFRAPTLKDAINNEKRITKEDNMVEFWRYIAKDCLTGAVIETEMGPETMEDTSFRILTRGDLFSTTLQRQDLKAIRDAMYCSDHPSLDFITEVRCHACEESTPVAINPASFFED